MGGGGTGVLAHRNIFCSLIPGWGEGGGAHRQTGTLVHRYIICSLKQGGWEWVGGVHGRMDEMTHRYIFISKIQSWGGEEEKDRACTWAHYHTDIFSAVSEKMKKYKLPPPPPSRCPPPHTTFKFLAPPPPTQPPQHPSHFFLLAINTT